MNDDERRAPFTVHDAEDRELPAIQRLLEQAALPTLDLASSGPSFVVAREGALVVGAGGLEVHGTTGLLRSVVVADRRRGAGIGRALVEAVEAAAGRRGLRELVLLTETAHDFFAGLGYEDIGREQAPVPVRDSAEFRALCPASARCMMKRLRHDDAA
jgi:amino-acid N-acetyltransferase